MQPGFRLPKHRFLVSGQHVIGDRVLFTPAQAHQMRSVLRLGVSDEVRVFDGVQPRDLIVRITRSHRGVAEGTALGEVPNMSETELSVHVFPALLPRDKFEQVLQKLVETGANAVTPVLAGRSVVRQPPDGARQERWQAIMQEAAEQCGRASVPCLVEAVPFAVGVTTALQYDLALLGSVSPRAVLLPAALERVSKGAQKSVGLLVGPEGGFTEEEEKHACEAGILPVRTGRSVMRAETASPVLVSLLRYELEDRREYSEAL